MSAIPQSNSESRNAYKQEQFPFSPIDLHTIVGHAPPPVINAERRRKIDYLADNYTGCIVLVLKKGKVTKNGIYRIQQFVIGPDET